MHIPDYIGHILDIGQNIGHKTKNKNADMLICIHSYDCKA